MHTVLLCLDRGVPLGGPKGCSVHLRAMATALLRRGHSVTTAVLEPGPQEGYAQAAALGLGVMPLKGRHDLSSLAAALIDVRPDLVIERLALGMPQGAEAASAIDVQHLYEVNAPLDREAAMHRGLVAVEAALEALKVGFAASSGAVAVSQEVADWVRELAPPDYEIQVVPNGADAHFFTAPSPEAKARARGLISPQPDEFRVVFAGSFRPWHDLDTLVRACARANDRKAVRLVLAGDGPQRPRIEALAQACGTRVTFTGHVPHVDVPALLAECHAAAVPYADSRSYFSPIKLIEAMAVGLPVIASATGPCREMISHGEDGLLVPPGNADAFAAALAALAADAALAQRLGGAARSKAAAHFTWDRAAERVLGFARETRAAARRA